MSSQTTTATRNNVWLALLLASSIGFSFATACATPFAAFAVIAGLTQTRRNALLFTGAVWLANQFIGFVFLHYPLNVECFTWGAILGAVAVFSTLVSARMGKKLYDMGYVCVVAAFAASFATYEGLLYAASLVMGGTEDYTFAIIGWIFAINAVALAGIIALNEISFAIGFAAYSLRISDAQKHA